MTKWGLRITVVCAGGLAIACSDAGPTSTAESVQGAANSLSGIVDNTANEAGRSSLTGAAGAATAVVAATAGAAATAVTGTRLPSGITKFSADERFFKAIVFAKDPATGTLKQTCVHYSDEMRQQGGTP